MDSFKWKDGFNIGIAEIDEQHRSFLDCLNDCNALISISGKNASIDQSLIDRLRAYATMHFRFEEGLMEAKGYPEIAQQRKMHKYFESQVDELEASLSKQGNRSLESVLSFLRDWFLNHVIEQDKRFASYVK
ncbi:MAG: hemerythrin family protein [Deltaproteobacteria bacterium]|nr:hemerythrin family protein [Deltaproteobacteria bacterium]